jgi:hypothetical protein
MQKIGRLFPILSLVVALVAILDVFPRAIAQEVADTHTASTTASHTGRVGSPVTDI